MSLRRAHPLLLAAVVLAGLLGALPAGAQQPAYELTGTPRVYVEPDPSGQVALHAYVRLNREVPRENGNGRPLVVIEVAGSRAELDDSVSVRGVEGGEGGETAGPRRRRCYQRYFEAVPEAMDEPEAGERVALAVHVAGRSRPLYASVRVRLRRRPPLMRSEDSAMISMGCTPRPAR